MREQNFNNWNELKKDLHFNKERIHFKQGEIYFMSVGQNIGYEIAGKKENFLRPVLVFRKFNKDTFLGIPLTSKKKKEGSYFFEFQYKKNIISTALLTQLRVFDSKRIAYYSGRINRKTFCKLEEKIEKILKITPQKEGRLHSSNDEQRKDDEIISKNSLIVKIPNNNLNERKYILDVVFNEFLGIDYEIDIEERENYEIVLENGKKLIIEDHFFNKLKNDLEYLKQENIPKKVEFVKNDFIVEDDIPVIYGTNRLINNNQSNTITCGIDIFASSFFMLTRWEEYVNKNRDIHNRFSATESLAYRFNFLDRPVVNEYVEMLKNMLFKLDDNLKFKTQSSKLFLTHDVDELYMWKNWKQVFRVALGDIVKRKSPSLALERFSEYFLIKRDKIKDPFDTFDWLMDKSEAVGVKSRFYFMSGGVTAYDNRYKIDEPKSLELIEKIKKRGHIIGIHPSYNAYNDFEQFKKEKELLESVVEQKIVEGREHYLRFEVPTTWQIWEDNGMEVDSTCGYADKEGFRCGTGDEFSVFNILSREKLKLRERPLVVMDCSLFGYNKYSYDKANEKINNIKNNTNSFTLLWHNSYVRDIKFYGGFIEKSNINSIKQL